MQLQWIKWYNPPGTNFENSCSEYIFIRCDTLEEIAEARTGGAPHTTKGACTSSGSIGSDFMHQATHVSYMRRRIEREVDRRSIGLLGCDVIEVVAPDYSHRRFMQFIAVNKEDHP